jgi:hypothetical protein
MYAFKQGAGWLPYTSQTLILEGTQDFYRVPPTWSDDEKRDRFGLHKVEIPEVPSGMRVVGQSIVGSATPTIQYDLEPIPQPTEEELRANLPDLTPRQFNLMLLQIDMDWADIEAGIEAISDTSIRKVAHVEFNRANSFRRSHPLVVGLGSSLGFPAVQLDALWAAAGDL